MDEFRKEMNNDEIDQYEILVSYRKIFLINAPRIKIDQTPQALENNSAGERAFCFTKIERPD
jgi:AraC family transcriptional regulator, transcriptional activator of pobA